MVRVIYSGTAYAGEIRLSSDAINYLKNNKINSVALFASVQFLNFENVIRQLNSLGINVSVLKTKRGERVGQVLGCNIYRDNFEEDLVKTADCVIYIGDGKFHPSALLFARAKSVLIYNPISDSFKVFVGRDIKKQMNKIKINLKKFISAKSIGILVSLKPGQQQLILAEKLKLVLEKHNKMVFIFIDNNFNLLDLENFNFIECWVNSACPRIGTDDILSISKPLINIRDAFEPVESLEKLENFGNK